MRIAIRTIQIIVAILFIISGLVKANDPLGLSYKMEEFFEIWNISLASGNFFAKGALTSLFNFLHGHSLTLSVIMITLEIVAGVALLTGWKKNLVLWILFVLIVFFTFLTGYAYLSKNADGSPKFTNCGCFGDCLPITPGTSFTKDLLLLLLIVFLLSGRKYILPVLTNRFRQTIILVTLLASLLLQWYVINYLPIVDCLPFKKGNNISEQIKAPKNSVPSIYETRLVYKNTSSGQVREMSQDEFNKSKIWEDSNWKWQESKTKLIKKGNDDPAIKGFTLTDSSGQDMKEQALSELVALIVFALTPGNSEEWLNEFKLVLSDAGAKQVPVYFATSDRDGFVRFFSANKMVVPVYACDFTVIRTAARTDPTLYLLRKGSIEKKYSYRHFKEASADIKK